MKLEVPYAKPHTFSSKCMGAVLLVALLGATHLNAATLHVWQDSPSPASPYTNWATAAHVIQDAVDAAVDGDTVLVTNGVYERITVNQAVTVESVNGAEVTVIVGRSKRCATLGDQAVLRGFGLYGGYAGAGGGAYGGTLYNCELAHCMADHAYGGAGGGACRSTLYNCTLFANSVNFGQGGGVANSTLFNCVLAYNEAYGIIVTVPPAPAIPGLGGGAFNSTLYNCTLVENYAEHGGGGVSGGRLYNCIVWGNSGNNYDYGGFAPPYWPTLEMFWCCTIPLPTNGFGNITKGPAFAGDFRLSYGSPCIDAGTNISDLLTTDLDDTPRPLDGNGDGTSAFDIGAYEFDLRTIVPTNWFTRYGLDPTNPQVVSDNSDNDALTSFQEWIADTDPTDASSCLRIEAMSNGPPTTIYIQTSSNRLYTLHYTSNLTHDGWSSLAGQTDVPGSGGMEAFSDTDAAPARFYKVASRVPQTSPPFTIFPQPQSPTVSPGSDVTFRVQPVGTPPLRYQWRLNGIAVAGATGSTLTITNVQPAHSGEYTVVVSDLYFLKTSAPATLTVLVPPTITEQPQPQTVTVGQNVTFSVGITNTATLLIGYTWRKLSAPVDHQILNAYSSSFTITNVQTSDAGVYSVIVTNAANFERGILSERVRLTVLDN